mmetsp:Transcript_111/g.256  ORF Transcript_111/g.256 Transcript_111/m.256 type:complete len:271 (-) Transcript_111:203-1015(-)
MHVLRCSPRICSSKLAPSVGRTRSVTTAAGLGSDLPGKGDKAQAQKQKLLKLVSGTNRGKDAQPEQVAEIIRAVEELEALNSIVNPALSPLVSGKWSLLYTGSASLEAAKERAEKEGVIGSTVTEMTGSSSNSAPLLPGGDPTKAPLGRRVTTQNGFINNKGNFQDIMADDGKVENRAEFDIFGAACELKIMGSCAQVPAEETDGEARRLAVAFDSVQFKLGPLGPLSIPLSWANGGKGPQGWVDTTYLDEELRVGRGDKGSIFVAARRK